MGRAREILDNWSSYLPKFVKVMPTDYKRVLREKGDLTVGVLGPEASQPQDRPAAE